MAEYPQKNRTTNHDMILRYYKGLGRHWIERLYEKYKPDFELFDYEIPPILLNL